MIRTPSALPPAVRGPASLGMLRDAVTDLGIRGTTEVSSVRTAFVSGIPPIQTASSGSKADFIGRFATEGVPAAIVQSTAMFGLSTAVVTAPPPPPRPELDFVEVGTDRAFGVLDSFFTRVVFSIPSVELARVSYFRVLRASTGPVRRAVRPSFSALADSIPLSARTKSNEPIWNPARMVGGVGVANRLTDFVADDAFSKRRNVLSGSVLRPLPIPLNTNRRGTSAGLLSVANGDRSVLEDATFYVNRRSVTSPRQIPLPLEAGQRQGVNVLRGAAVGASTAIVAQGNSLGFSEVARIAVVPARSVGAIAEFEYFDPSVVYGGGYVYYVVAVSGPGVSGPRSRLVVAEVTRDTLPRSPEVMYAVSGAPRFVIRSSGSFIDHFEVFRRGGAVPTAVRLLSTDRSMIDSGPAAMVDSGFYHIGDVGATSDRSAVFVDRSVVPGLALDYRVYTVDSFGLKSQTPFSCSITLPDPGRVIPLGLPSITVEQAPGGRIVNVGVSCDDPRVTSFVVARRDRSIRDNAFRQPTQPDYFAFGSTTAKRSRSRSGPALSQFSAQAWNGVFLDASGSTLFPDRSVEFDRVYQYSVYGVDIRGNRTSSVPAPPVFVAVKPVADAPVAVTGTVLVDSSGFPAGVMVAWHPGTIDFSPGELISDQDVLAATSQRSVFQVERRQVGKSRWESMPATTASFFVDPVGRGQAPKFRPAFAVPNLEYDYRVIAMQSGAFLSTHTDSVRVVIAPEIAAPASLAVRTSSTAVRPVRIVVSWQYVGIFVDGWEVERAVTNKIFGSRVFSMDSAEARSLAYTSVAHVTRESSMGLGLSGDPAGLDPRVFLGNRAYVDMDVSMANSYFYRVRAFDAVGRVSGWSYGGVSLTDSPFDRKFLSALSDRERTDLSLDQRPLRGWEDE